MSKVTWHFQREFSHMLGEHGLVVRAAVWTRDVKRRRAGFWYAWLQVEDNGTAPT